MSRRNLPPDLEDELRVWTGRLLTDGTAMPVPHGIDYQTILLFFQMHGVQSLIADQVDPQLLPPDLRARNETIRNQAAAVEIATTEEFASVVNALQNRIRPIVFKGQALAYSLYTRPWHRPRADVDALIDRTTLDDTGKIFRQLGYKAIDAIDGDLVLRQTTFRKQWANVSHNWDVHWAISNRPALAGTLSYGQLLEGAIEIGVDTVATLTPNHVHSLLIAGLHLIGHHSSDVRVIWLYDIHLLVHALSDTQCDEFLSTAGSHAELRAACRLALSLTQRYLPSERTNTLSQQLGPASGNAKSLRQSYLRRLFDDTRALRQGERSRFFRQHLFPSRDYMARRFGIRHRWQLPFWYAVRIGRALPKLFKRR